MSRLIAKFGFDGDDLAPVAEQRMEAARAVRAYAGFAAMAMSARMEDAQIEHITRVAQYLLSVRETDGALIISVVPAPLPPVCFD